MKPLLLAALLGSALAHAADALASKPNIILVMPDDVGYGDYACLGNPVIHTPTVDAFKKEGVLFTQFHVSPTCSPCRSALMSGRHEFKNGVTHTILERERMSLKTFTLAQMLKSAGYTTGIFGKWHLGDEEAYRPENRGFDEVYIHGGGGIGQTYPGSCGDAPGNTNIDPALWHNGKFEKTKGYCTDLFFAQAIKWMDAKRRAKQPFFAYIPLNAAHAPLVVPEEYYQQYLGKPGVNERRRQVLRHDREHRHELRQAAREAQGMGHRGQHAGHLHHQRQRRHGGHETLQRRHARRQRHALSRRHPRGGLLPLAGRQDTGRRGVRRLERAPRHLPHAGRDHRGEALRRRAEAGRGPQPAGRC